MKRNDERRDDERDLYEAEIRSRQAEKILHAGPTDLDNVEAAFRLLGRSRNLLYRLRRRRETW